MTILVRTSKLNFPSRMTGRLNESGCSVFPRVGVRVRKNHHICKPIVDRELGDRRPQMRAVGLDAVVTSNER